jgi:beta-galactosidase/beta-glucuronidase
MGTWSAQLAGKDGPGVAIHSPMVKLFTSTLFIYFFSFGHRYRKHFHVPETWKGSYIEVTFGAIFHLAVVYLNGEQLGIFHSGYSEIRLRLDNISSLVYGETDENVIVVRADSSFGSGHWYEGGGLYRNVWLSRENLVHIAAHGVYSPSELPMSGEGYVCICIFESF